MCRGTMRVDGEAGADEMPALNGVLASFGFVAAAFVVS